MMRAGTKRQPQGDLYAPKVHRAKRGRKLGRPRKDPKRAGSPHKKRPEHKKRFPLHIVLRVAPAVGSLRKRFMYRALREATIAVALRELAYDDVKGAFRVVHVSIQRSHVHLLVEADNKLALARGIVARYHSDEAARAAENHFSRVVRQHEAPEEVPQRALPTGDPIHLPALLADAFGLSTSEARRLIAQGAVKLDGDAVSELDLPRAQLAGAVLQAGKRRFVRLNEPA